MNGSKVIGVPSRELTYPPDKGIFEDDFPNFPRWDMLISWRVDVCINKYLSSLMEAKHILCFTPWMLQIQWCPIFFIGYTKSFHGEIHVRIKSNVEDNCQENLRYLRVPFNAIVSQEIRPYWGIIKALLVAKKTQSWSHQHCWNFLCQTNTAEVEGFFLFSLGFLRIPHKTSSPTSCLFPWVDDI